MRLRLLLPGLLALVLVFAACAPAPELRDEKMLQDNSVVTGEPCAAPCWRGITPGETTWSSALTILEDDPTLENISTQTDENSPAMVADWQQQGGSPCCQMFTDDGETVKIVFLRTAPGNTVGEVMDVHGEPTYVVGSPYSDDQAIMNLVYPEKRMVVYAFVPGTSGDLSASGDIVGLLYMTQADMDLLLVTSSLHSWNGYDTYQAYDESEFEVTPSVTLTPTATGN